MTIDDINEKNAFGFTFVDATEYEEYEKSLKEQAIQHAQTSERNTGKLKAVLEIINPFLKTLGSDPTKKYIKWENRAAKIKEIEDKIYDIWKE